MLNTVLLCSPAHVYHLPGHPWEHTAYTDPHRLTLLLAIFAIGALLDPKRDPYNSDADDYYHLSRVALSFKSPVLDTTANAILAIVGFFKKHWMSSS